MKILFARGYLSRKPKYRVNTIIYQNKKRVVVRKYAVDNQALKHLQNLSKSRALIAKHFPNFLFPKLLNKEKSFIEFEYLVLPSLELLVEKALLKKNFNETKKYLLLFRKAVENTPLIKYNPYENPNFIKIFDPQEKKSDNIKEDCVEIASIDLNFDNLLLDKKNNLYLVDWEWTYNFPIYKNFLLFRSLLYLSRRVQSIIATVCSEDFPCYEVLNNFLIPKIWFDIFNFSQDEIKKMLFYEANFQNTVNSLELEFNESLILANKRVIKERFSQNLGKYINSQLSQKQVEIDRKDSQLSQKQAENQQLRKQVSESTALIDQVKLGNEILKKRADEFMSLIAILKSEINKKNKKLKQLEKKLKAIEKEKQKRAEELQKENENIRQQIYQTQMHIQNLESTLNKIKSAKFFKLWQAYCKIRDKLLLKS